MRCVLVTERCQFRLRGFLGRRFTLRLGYGADALAFRFNQNGVLIAPPAYIAQALPYDFYMLRIGSLTGGRATVHDVEALFGRGHARADHPDDFMWYYALPSREFSMRFRSVASLLAFCCLFANGCSKDISRATAATVFSVKGNVVFGNSERNHFQPVTLKSRIHSGNTVRSADGASINLALIPGTLAQLSGNSEIKIEEVRITKDGNQTAGGMRDRRARIRLHRGKIIVLFNRSDRSASQFAITARELTVRADSDCLFCVWTDGTTSRVTCARGEITASADGRPPAAIAAGYFRKSPTARKEPLAAADDAATQIDITESLEIGEQLRDQALGWQNRRPL